MKAHIAIAFLTTLLIGGAIYLKAYNPPLGPPAFDRFFRSETFHIPAHLLLYGALAVCWRSLLARRWYAVFGAVLAVGLLQEAAQSLLWQRWAGPAELFDLGVDTLSIAVVLALWPLWERRARARLPNDPGPAPVGVRDQGR